MRIIASLDSGVERLDVTFLTDVEGNWEYFEAFVRASEALQFKFGADGKSPLFDMEGAADVELKPGWRFVHGGDTVDKGK